MDDAPGVAFADASVTTHAAVGVDFMHGFVWSGRVMTRPFSCTDAQVPALAQAACGAAFNLLGGAASPTTMNWLDRTVTVRASWPA